MANALDMVAGVGQFGFDPLGDFVEGRKARNYLDELKRTDKARTLTGSALQGDKNALRELPGVDPGAFMEVSKFQQQDADAKAEKIASALYKADTPEKWATTINYLKQTGHDVSPEEENFANREAVLGEYQSLKDQQSQANNDRSFAADERYRDRSLSIQERELVARNAKADRDPFLEREEAAQRLGLDPDSPEYQTYVLTGRMPQEQRSTASDRAAIRDSDDAAFSAENAISQLNEALELNTKAGSGYFANAQAFAARNDPTGFFDDTKGEATTNFNNLILNQALGSLKAIFGAAPTEGERAILLELQASVDKTPQEREPILKRAIALANRRLQYNKDRSEELRGGTYYQPGRGPGGTGQAPQPKQGAATPPANADELIEQANDAINRGADPRAVQQRLREQGVEADFAD